MVKKFTGQVKAQEIRDIFDSFSKEINSIVDDYNASIDVSDIDFSKGGTSLGAYNYTLTVGGLKTLLSACNGTVVGFKVFKNGNGIITTEGLYVTTDGVKRIPAYSASTIAGRFIHWNSSNNTFTVNNNRDSISPVVTVAEIEPKRERSAELNDLGSVEIEGNTLKIKVGNKYKDQHSDNIFDSSNGAIFLSGSESIADEGHQRRALLFNTEVSWNQQPGHRRRTYWQLVNALYIPKGFANPYTYQMLSGGNWQNSGNTQMTMPVEKKYS